MGDIENQIEVVFKTVRDISDETIDSVVKYSVTKFYNNIVDMTPVDTGAARDSWDIEIRPNTVLISNPLNYITMLEYGGYAAGPKTIGGFSKQAPNGMVRVSALKFQQFIDQACEAFKL